MAMRRLLFLAALGVLASAEALATPPVAPVKRPLDGLNLSLDYGDAQARFIEQTTEATAPPSDTAAPPVELAVPPAPASASRPGWTLNPYVRDVQGYDKRVRGVSPLPLGGDGRHVFPPDLVSDRD